MWRALDFWRKGVSPTISTTAAVNALLSWAHSTQVAPKAGGRNCGSSGLCWWETHQVTLLWEGQSEGCSRSLHKRGVVKLDSCQQLVVLLLNGTASVERRKVLWFPAPAQASRLPCVNRTLGSPADDNSFHLTKLVWGFDERRLCLESGTGLGKCNWSTLNNY